LAAALVIPALLGCSDRPELVPVAGIVLIDGQPLSGGNVKFVPDTGRASWGTLDSSGRFTLSCYEKDDGALPGKHRVQVSALEVLSNNKSKWFAPRKYADFRTSGLSVDVNELTDEMKIDLTWDGSPPGKPFID
jgi:hypothetical protein